MRPALADITQVFSVCRGYISLDLNSLKGESTIGAIEGDTRSLEDGLYKSYTDCTDQGHRSPLLV